jgi:hypothetical protein
MHADCNGTTYISVSCLTVAHVYVENFEFFYFRMSRMANLSLQREREGHQRKMHGVWKKFLQHPYPLIRDFSSWVMKEPFFV